MKSDEASYAFLKHEMTATAEKKVVPALKAVGDLNSAVEVFMTVYERPGIPALKRRIAFAQMALDASKVA